MPGLLRKKQNTVPGRKQIVAALRKLIIPGITAQFTASSFNCSTWEMIQKENDESNVRDADRLTISAGITFSNPKKESRSERSE